MNIDLYTNYLTSLLRCAILNENAADMPSEIDAQEFFNFCLYHKVENIAFSALKNTDTSLIPKDVWGMFEEFNMHSIANDATQLYYLEMIENEFEKHGIDYLVLKGKEISRLYPSSDMRQSSDFDIYVGRKNAARAKDIMLDNGFSIVSYSDTDDFHDEYIIDGQIMCELHRVLIQNEYPWQTECNKITDRLILCSDTKHRYKMRDEDFYLYNLAHTAKHMKFSGIGIKAFLDLWIIYNHYKDSMDWDYLNLKLKQSKLKDFDAYARSLCDYWFENKKNVSETVITMSRYVAVSGWMGTAEQAMSTELAENAGASNSKLIAKIKKCIDIIFSPYDTMVIRYPILKRYKILMPFCRIHRAFSAVIHKRELIKNVTGELDIGNMESGKAILQLKRNIGL